MHPAKRPLAAEGRGGGVVQGRIPGFTSTMYIPGAGRHRHKASQSLVSITNHALVETELASVGPSLNCKALVVTDYDSCMTPAKS